MPWMPDSVRMISVAKALGGACVLATAVGIPAYYARDKTPASQDSGAAIQLFARAAARDVASASRAQAGSGLGVLVHKKNTDAPLSSAVAQPRESGQAVAQAQESSLPQDEPPSAESIAVEPQPADTRRQPSAKPEPLPEGGPLNPRALGNADVWRSASLGPPSGAPPAAAPGAGAAARIDPSGASAGLADPIVPEGRAKLRLRPTAGPGSAASAPAGARKYTAEKQTLVLAKAGSIAPGRFAEMGGRGSKVDPGEGAAQPGADGHGAQAAGANAGAGGAGAGDAAVAGTEYRYGPHERNVLDFYKGTAKRLPGEAAKPTPLVVFFHGGGFYRGDKSDAQAYLSMMNRGYSMASCNYRLLSNPSQINKVALAAYDARNAVRWLRDNAAMLGVDPSRFVAVGASAGGYLAAMLGSAGNAGLADGATSGTSPAVQAVIDLAGPTDFGGKVIAPMQFVDGGDPPTMIRHGRLDPVVSSQHSVSYAAKLRGANVTVDFVLYDGVGHTIDPVFRQQLIKESMDFADKALR